MAKQNVNAIYNDTLYIITKESEKFIVTGKEINTNIQHCVIPTDNILLIQESANYRIGDSILTGKEIIAKASAMPVVESLPEVAMWGAFFIGFVLGWNLYLINRHRVSSGVGIGDITVISSAIISAGILQFFGNSSELIGWYGLGLGAGFLVYGALLIVLEKGEFPMGRTLSAKLLQYHIWPLRWDTDHKQLTNRFTENPEK